MSASIEKQPNAPESKKGLGQFAQALPIFFRRAVADLAIEFLKSTPLEIVHFQNLELVKKEMAEERSIVIGENHHGMFEPAETFRVLMGELNLPLDKIGAFMSQKFFDGRMGLMTIITDRMRERGINALSIMQDYDSASTPEERVRNNLDSMKKAIRMLKKKPGSAMVIYPEGTRTKIIRKGQEGVFSLLKHSKSLFVPISFENTGGSTKKQLRNLMGGMRMIVGSPVEAEKIQEESEKYNLDPQDIMMLYIAALLPVGLRGYYEGINHRGFFDFYRDHGICQQPEEENRPKTPVVVLGIGPIGALLATELTQSTPTTKVAVGVREGQIAQTQKVFQGMDVETSTVAKALESNPEIIFVATQNPTREVIREIKEHATLGATLVFLQNGVDVVHIAEEELKSEELSVVRATIYTPVSGIGMENYKLSKLRASVSSVNEKDIQAAWKVQELLQKVGFDVVYCEDYKGMELAKLLSNLVGTTGSVTGLSLGETIRDRELFELELIALRDRLAILGANGIELPKNIPWLAQVDQLSSIPPKIALLLRDVIARVAAGQRKEPNATARRIQDNRPTEASFYHGPFIELGAGFGLRSAVDEVILSLVSKHETGKINLNKMSPEQKKALLLKEYKRDNVRVASFVLE